MSSPAQPRRSDRTRAAILGAARERFAADGYERATIRAIAADAAIDPAMVMRYFGNKENLFAAAAEHDLRLPDLTALPPAERGAALARHFIDLWEDEDTLEAMLRAAATNAAVTERARSLFSRQVRGTVAAVVPDPGQASLRAGLVASQVLGLALCRYMLRLPPVVAMSRAEVVEWLGPTLQRYLTEEAP